MVLQHIVSFSNIVVSDIYLKTARKQEKKSQETKISKRQHEVEETHHVQQTRDVYYEYRSNGSLDLWQKIEGICPTDLLSFVVGDILKISKYYSEPGASKLIYDKFKLHITNFNLSKNFTASLLNFKIMAAMLKGLIFL